MTQPAKNTICLWYDGGAEDAARFYAKTFPNSSVGAVHRAPGDFPSGKKGDVLTVEFTVMGIPCLGLNGGPAVKHSEAFSFQVSTADQAETDLYWDAIVGNGGEERACGVQGQMGLVVADYASGADAGHHGSRPRSRQACFRCDDADEKDRHRHNRGSPPRLKNLGEDAAGSNKHRVPLP
jgi:predicted 3-demethylubiquinone-9 3-methyltransferase (glyoxalase superfamily)